MIAVLGSTGYMGAAFCHEIINRGIELKRIGPAKELTYRHLCDCLDFPTKPELVINCAAYIPTPTVQLCDDHPAETIQGNVLFPSMVAHACDNCFVPLAHLSTGCLWNDGKEHPEEDLPQRGFGGWCGFYVGTKIIAESVVMKFPRNMVWRIRLPFSEIDHPKNYLSKLASYPEVWDQKNAASHVGDSIKACLDLWQLSDRSATGIYHVVNPGEIAATQVVARMMELGIRSVPPHVFVHLSRFLLSKPEQTFVNWG